MDLDHLGAYIRAYATRNQPEGVNISGLRFSAAQLSNNFSNQHFTMSLIPVFICFHIAFLAAAIAGVSFQERPVSAVSLNPCTGIRRGQCISRGLAGNKSINSKSLSQNCKIRVTQSRQDQLNHVTKICYDDLSLFLPSETHVVCGL